MKHTYHELIKLETTYTSSKLRQYQRRSRVPKWFYLIEKGNTCRDVNMLGTVKNVMKQHEGVLKLTKLNVVTVSLDDLQFFT